jgi:hypothetical protein
MNERSVGTGDVVAIYSGIRFTKNPQLLMRIERLKRLISFGPVNPESVSLYEALAFLIQNNGSSLGHPRLKILSAYCQEKVMAEAGVKVSELLSAHGKMLENLEDQYE